MHVFHCMHGFWGLNSNATTSLRNVTCHAVLHTDVQIVQNFLTINVTLILSAFTIRGV